MKKSTGVSGVIIILGIAYVGASWYIGKQAQTMIEQAVEQANQRLVGVLGPDLGGDGPKCRLPTISAMCFRPMFWLTFNEGFRWQASGLSN